MFIRREFLSKLPFIALIPFIKPTKQTDNPELLSYQIEIENPIIHDVSSLSSTVESGRKCRIVLDFQGKPSYFKVKTKGD